MNIVSVCIGLLTIWFTSTIYADALIPSLVIKGQTDKQHFIAVELNPDDITANFPTY